MRCFSSVRRNGFETSKRVKDPKSVRCNRRNKIILGNVLRELFAKVWIPLAEILMCQLFPCFQIAVLFIRHVYPCPANLLVRHGFPDMIFANVGQQVRKIEIPFSFV